MISPSCPVGQSINSASLCDCVGGLLSTHQWMSEAEKLYSYWLHQKWVRPKHWWEFNTESSNTLSFSQGWTTKPMDWEWQQWHTVNLINVLGHRSLVQVHSCQGALEVTGLSFCTITEKQWQWWQSDRDDSELGVITPWDLNKLKDLLAVHHPSRYLWFVIILSTYLGWNARPWFQSIFFMFIWCSILE